MLFSRCLFTNRSLSRRLKGKSSTMQSGEARLNIYSSFDCDVTMNSSWSHEVSIEPLGMINLQPMVASREETVDVSFKFDQDCSNIPDNYRLNTTVTFVRGQVDIFSLVHPFR